MRKPKDPKSSRKKKSVKPESPEPKDAAAGVSSETGSGNEPDAGLAAKVKPAPDAEVAAESVTEPQDGAATGAATGDANEDVNDEVNDPAAAPVFAPEEPSLDAPPHDDLGHDEEHEHRNLATSALMILVGIIVVASLTLWAAPKLAPHLPAKVAQYLLPGQVDTQARLADLNEDMAASATKMEAAIATLNAEVEALTARLDANAEASQDAASQTEAAIAAARSSADATAESLAAHLDTFEARLASLRDEFAAVSSALAEAGADEGATSSETAAAVATIAARLDSLASLVDDTTATDVLGARISDLEARLDAVESMAADARDVQNEALDEVSSEIRQARLQAAFDLLASRLTGGLSYAAKLDEITELTGAAPPEALATGADAGLATAESLEVSFGRHAQAAIAADVQANAGEGAGSQALGWLKSQVAGRPTAEKEGDSVAAVTSRISARVGEGKLAEALTEAEALPEHAQKGLGGWLDRLRARVAADAALAGWSGQIGFGG